jgi:hypothetical protein
MKQIYALSIMTLGFLTSLQAATTYNITSDTKWSSSLPSYCNKCTINISSGVILTLNSGMCNDCTFSGGTLKVTGGFSFQSSAISNTTINTSTSFNMYSSNSLNNVILNMTAGNLAPGPLTVDNSTFSFTGSSGFTINGGSDISNSSFTFANSSSLVSNGAMSIVNTTFNFENSADFTNNGKMDLDASFLYFNDNSHLLSNSAIDLDNGSKLVAGDGSKTSGAYIYMNAKLNLLDDDSYVIISNTSNHFHSWSGYTYNGHTYSTVVNSNPDFFGGAVFSSTGTLPITVLPVTMGDFKAAENNQHAIKLSWKVTDASGRETMQIERSNDATHFTPLTTISVTGTDAGYTYTDESPVAGENDYRIKLTGADGTVSYSKIISINVNTATSGEPHIFPNPCTGGNFQIRFPAMQSAMIRVFTLDGKLLYMNSVKGQSQYSIQVPAAGNTRMLIVQIITNEKTSSFNLLNGR